MTNSKSSAFTLIELLVVIVIIAVLAGIALPVFGTVQENGRMVKCSSNLRQIGAGMFMFAQEHNGYFPQSSASGTEIQWGNVGGDTHQPSWVEQLGPYIGTVSSSSNTTNDPKLANGKSIFTCPSSSITASMPNDKYYSYFNGVNAAVALSGTTGGGMAAVKQQLIKNPSGFILSGDVTNGSFSSQLNADKNDSLNGGAFDSTKVPMGLPAGVLKPLFHRGMINLLYADGHAATVQWTSSLQPSIY